MTLKWYFLRWLRGPASIINGLIQTLTFGFVEPGVHLKCEDLFLNYSVEMIANQSQSNPVKHYGMFYIYEPNKE